jgi:hypothetical protein
VIASNKDDPISDANEGKGNISNKSRIKGSGTIGETSRDTRHDMCSL